MMHGGCQAGTQIPDQLLFCPSLSLFCRKDLAWAVIVYVSASQIFLELRESAHCVKLAIQGMSSI